MEDKQIIGNKKILAANLTIKMSSQSTKALLISFTETLLKNKRHWFYNNIDSTGNGKEWQYEKTERIIYIYIWGRVYMQLTFHGQR